MNLVDGYAEILAAARRGHAPDPELQVDRWSEQYMVLPKDAAEPGPYRIDRTPPARRIMQCLSPRHPAKRVVIRGASQMLKTQVAINFLAASAHQAPANMLVLEPTDGLARRLSARITKVIRDVPVLQTVFAPPRSRDSRNTVFAKDFAGGTMYIATSGSAANLSEIPARYVVVDEVDRNGASVDGEGDPVELAEARATTFGANSKFLEVSSPTRKGLSKIDALYASGTQEVYAVPCPHCGHHHELVLENFRYSRDEASGHMSRAWFVCPECGAEIDERHKARMMRDAAMGGTAHWQARSEGDGETVSFHISAFYAQTGSITWLGLARQHARAQERLDRGDAEAMKVFWNTRLALSWEEVGDAADEHALQARAEIYPLCTVPAGGLVLTTGVDLQGNRWEIGVWAWGAGMESWVIDHHIMEGNPQSDDDWQQVADYLRRSYPQAWHGGSLSTSSISIDANYQTQAVHNFVRQQRQKGLPIQAIRGENDPKKPIKCPGNPQDVTWKGQKWPRGVKLWGVGVKAAKDLLHGQLQLEAAGPGYVHTSAELPREWYEQLTAEQRITVQTTHGAVERWVKRRPRNEVLDCRNYALHAAYMLGLHQLDDAAWLQAAQRIQPPREVKAPAAASTRTVAPSVRSGIAAPQSVPRGW